MFPVLALLVGVLALVKSQPCPNNCNGQGRCDSPGRQCTCFDGYTGADCSERFCPFGLAWSDLATGVDLAHNSAECSNMGICDRSTGLCTCNVGYEGKACERMSCPSYCSYHGECQSMYYYALSKDPGSGTVYPYTSIWDAYKIYGCNCDTGFYGSDCSLRSCPTGDDPLTGTGATGNPLQYNEVQKVYCRASGGSFTLSYKGKTTTWIPYNAQASALQSALEALPTVGTGGVKIVMYNAQACIAAGTSWTVEFLQNFGALPLLVPNSQALTFTGSVSSVLLQVTEQTKGTKENSDCSNRGICDPSVGYCGCSTNYDTSNGYNAPGTRGDCGYATSTIQFCPGLISCSGHGECTGNPKYQCLCSSGWYGADCSLRSCPTGLSWFSYPESSNSAHITTYSTCSDKGICDYTTGTCTCNTGFTGAACDRLSCPGTTATCNGHGQCLSMSDLAQLATVNGDLGGFTYGNTPNNPVTWDAAKIYGCYCDSGYQGYDCSLRTCPFGDDPSTTGQLDEQQLLTCTDADLSGTIVLTFRTYSTAILLPTYTSAQVLAALESLSSIQVVSVAPLVSGGTDQLCTSTGNSLIITFLTEHGNLPLITAVTQNIDSFVVSEYRMGTKENILCSGRGLCDTAIGECVCFTGYGSSDGMGGSGNMGDCGYIEPISA